MVDLNSHEENPDGRRGMTEKHIPDKLYLL